MKDRVLEYLFAYKRKNGKYPSPKQIAIALDISIDDVKQAFHDLRRDGVIRVYPGEDGKVSSYYIPSDIAARAEIHQPEPKKEVTPEVKQTSKMMTVIVIGVIAIMTLIAVGAMAVSTYFSLQWTSTFLPGWVAVILSGGIVIYIAFAPEGALLLYETSAPDAKGKKHIPGIGKLLLITALLALFFSMSMTIIGQFNRNTELIEKKSKESKTQNESFETLEVLKKSEKDFEKSKKYAETDLETAQREKLSFETNSKERKNIEWKITTLKQDIKKYETKLEENRNAQTALIGSGAKKDTKRYNFYEWFSETFGPPSGIVEFILYLIPAFFCDVISPLGISLSIYLSIRFFKRKEN